MNNFFAQTLLLFADAEPQKRKRWLYWLWVGLLVVIGILIWGKFFNWGLGPYTYHDWADITIPRTTFLMNAVRQGVLPLHIADGFVLGEITTRFMTVPDLLLSPQIFLLRWLDVEPFLLVNFLLLYGIGFAGLLWLGRKLRISLLGLTVMFVLFNFNGNLVAHFSVGHYTWTAYFLFPWFIGLIIDLINGTSGGWRWVMHVSLLQLAILLQGGYHQFIWGLFLLALLIPVLPGRFSILLRALVFSVLINAVRLLPPILNLGRFDDGYVAGYPFVQTLWYSLTQVYLPFDFTFNYHLTGTLGTWEYAMFVGLVGVTFLVWFGMVRAFQRRGQAGNYAALLFPVLGFILLSMDQVFQYLRKLLPLPLFTGERVPARMSLIAMLLVLVLAVIELQHWLDKIVMPDQQAEGARAPLASSGVILSSFIVIGLIVNDLWQNLYLWRIPAAAAAFGIKAFNAQRWSVTNHADPAYFSILAIGGVISLVSLLALVYLNVHKRHLPQQAPVHLS